VSTHVHRAIVCCRIVCNDDVRRQRSKASSIYVVLRTLVIILCYPRMSHLLGEEHAISVLSRNCASEHAILKRRLLVKTYSCGLMAVQLWLSSAAWRSGPGVPVPLHYRPQSGPNGRPCSSCISKNCLHYEAHHRSQTALGMECLDFGPCQIPLLLEGAPWWHARPACRRHTAAVGTNQTHRVCCESAPALNAVLIRCSFVTPPWPPQRPALPVFSTYTRCCTGTVCLLCLCGQGQQHEAIADRPKSREVPRTR
jgi:hypothetical protein